MSNLNKQMPVGEKLSTSPVKTWPKQVLSAGWINCTNKRIVLRISFASITDRKSSIFGVFMFGIFQLSD